jgi:hypothetical protein
MLEVRHACRVWWALIILHMQRRALLHSYCTVDYARLLDVTQLRLFKLRKALKDRVQDRCACSTVTVAYHPTYTVILSLNALNGPHHLRHADMCCVRMRHVRSQMTPVPQTKRR